MENTVHTEYTENDKIKIKEINEDSYWTKEYGISMEDLKKTGSNIGIFDKIVDTYIKTKNFSM